MEIQSLLFLLPDIPCPIVLTMGCSQVTGTDICCGILIYIKGYENKLLTKRHVVYVGKGALELYSVNSQGGLMHMHRQFPQSLRSLSRQLICC